MKLWYGSLRAWIAPEHQTAGSSFEVDTPNALAGVKFSQPVIEVSYDPRTKTSLFKAYTVALIVRNSVTGERKQIPQGLQVVVRDESTVTMPLPAQQIPSPQDDIPEAPQTEPPADSSMRPPAESLTESPAEIPKTAPKAVPAVPAAPTNPSFPVQETRSNTTPSTTQTRESPVKSTNIAEQARYVSRGATSSSAPVSVGVVSVSDSSASASSGESGAATTETSANPSPGTRTESAEQRVYRPIVLRIHQE